ncbi:MAG: hypothetical protein HZC28_03090 [Spirochaetes bacterium]|nr:hypothetical protein [Spirochaetota bacterium]
MRLTCVIIALCTWSVYAFGASLPTGAILLEAERYISDKRVTTVEDVQVSGGACAIWKKAGTPDYFNVISMPFPSSGTYTVWICQSGSEFCLKSDRNKEIKWIFAKDRTFTWRSFGSFSANDLGTNFSVMVSPKMVAGADEGRIDAVLLSPDAGFVPSGIYGDSVTRAEDTGQIPDAAATNSVTIDFSADGGAISPWLASANINSPSRHLITNRAWDETMRGVFGGRIVRVQVGPRKEPDAAGIWWDFATLDDFFFRATNVWGVSAVLCSPNYQITGWDKKAPPTDEMLANTAKKLAQLVERYGTGARPAAEYWETANEWWGGYWEKNPEEFYRCYIYLSEVIRAVNPRLKIGGPTDAYPTQARIETLAKRYTNLAFTSWHMYATGRADTPEEKIYTMANNIKKSAEQARTLARTLGRELPLIISEYHINYKAWDPPDARCANGTGGVWNAFVLSRLATTGCLAAMVHDVAPGVYGLFSPRDSFSAKLGLIPPLPPSPGIDDPVAMRPIGAVHRFFADNVAGGKLASVTLKDESPFIDVLAATSGTGNRVVVVVNASSAVQRFLLESPSLSGSGTYLRATKDGVQNGSDTFFRDGKADITLPPYAALMMIVLKREVK